MFRRKIMPEPLRAPYESFLAQAERVEKARQALLSCLPVGRVDPAPVPVGLDLLRDELTEVRAALPAWRVDPVATIWEACATATDEARDGIERAHAVATTTTELEELLGAVADVIEPLDAWGEAERAWLRMRVRT